MKVIFSTAIIATLLVTANHSRACSQAPYVYMQSSSISTVLASENFTKELARHFDADYNVSIVKIESK